MQRATLLFLTLLTIQPALWAMGRRSQDGDTFPDYNRLDMHPKPSHPPLTAAPAPAVRETPPPRPPLNTPVNPTAVDDTVPRAPPAAVPVPADSSEPPLPDSMMGTLVPSATAQK